MFSQGFAETMTGFMCLLFGGLAILMLFNGNDEKLLQDSAISSIAAWHWKKMK